MSQWTHIAGVVRIDALVAAGIGTDKTVEEQIKDKLGKIVTFDSSREYWDLPDEKKTPMGSEGGVNYFYKVTAESSSSISRGVIAIDADLRDYGNNPKEDIAKILNWINKLVQKKEGEKLLFFIRQGVIQVEIEDNKTIYIVFNSEDNIFKIKK